MKIDKNGIFIDDYNKNLERRCVDSSCQKKYSINEYLEGSEGDFYPPVNYIDGCSKSCLECWLGVSEFMDNDTQVENDVSYELGLEFPTEHGHWYDSHKFDEIGRGNLEVAYEKYIKDDCHLIVIPLSRVSVDRAIYLPCGLIVYPVGGLDFSDLEFNSEEDCELSSIQSLSSGVTIDSFTTQALLVLPIKLNWNSLLFKGHSEHMELIRTISEMFDAMFFNFLKYENCQLTYIPDEGLPNLLGQINSNPMMAGALFLKNGTRKAKLISGAATHTE